MTNNITRLENLAQYYDAQRDRYRNEDRNPNAEKYATNAADNAFAIRWAVKHATELEEAIRIIIGNAKMIPDPNMGGSTDCFSVPLDDINEARSLLRP